MPHPTAKKAPTDLIHLADGEATTTSLLVADKFGKRHRDVLRAIRNLDCPEDFRLRNFAQSYYTNEQDKAQPMYRLTRDGFAFLAMGFTGKEAARWKVRFLEAFNAMELHIKQQESYRATHEWLEARASGKVIRLEFTDGVAEFVDYAERQGSSNARKYYMALTKMEYRALFLVGQAVGEAFRNRLNVQQLVNLATAEAIAQRALRDGMAQHLFYKDIYQLAKQRVEALAGMLGKTLPGAPMRRIAA